MDPAQDDYDSDNKSKVVRRTLGKLGRLPSSLSTLAFELSFEEPGLAVRALFFTHLAQLKANRVY